MVAVRMVSEGVDVPRLAVGVYATSTSTPLFFAQAVGRFVRARRRGETASVFLPSVPLLLQHAAEMEVERDHALDRRPSTTRATCSPPRTRCWPRPTGPPTEPGAETSSSFEALEAEATFDRVLFDGGEFGTQAAVGSEEEVDFLGLPGLLEPDQVATLLQRPAERAAGQPHGARRSRRADAVAAAEAALHRALPPLRKELNGLVGRLAPPHRAAARRHPHRAAAGLRRTARRPGHGRQLQASASTRSGAGRSRRR